MQIQRYLHKLVTTGFIPPPRRRGLGGGEKTLMDNGIQQLARNLRNVPTDAERLLWQPLRKRQMLGYKFRRQQVFEHYIVDFVCIEAKLIIELDGGQHAEQQQADAQRTEYLERFGYQVMRFWNHQVFMELEAVKEEIAQYLLKQNLV